MNAESNLLKIKSATHNIIKANNKYILGISHERLPFRGGAWSNGSGAGVFALNLNNTRGISNTNVGFRSALLS